MKRQLRIHPGARVDLEEQAEFIARDSPQAAKRFVERATTTFEWLRSSPALGKRWQSSRRATRTLRWFPVRGFRKHLVFYSFDSKQITIVRVLHGARDLASLLR